MVNIREKKTEDQERSIGKFEKGERKVIDG